MASLTELGSLQAALSDLYGDGLSILCATGIQRYLAGLDSDAPVGEPAGDENDLSVKEMSKNISLVISNASFSCGNLLPCSLKALDNSILLLGQTSGGGSCEVGYISTMLGSVMQISSEMMLVTMKNGYIRDIDGGVDPDIPLSTSRLFDRDYIVSLVNDYFG